MSKNRILRYNWELIALFILTFSCTHGDNQEINLAGVWNFSVDSLDAGIRDQWYNNPINADTIRLPGSMAENGKGNDITLHTHWTGNMWNDSLWYKSPKYAKYRQAGNIKVSLWLQPVKKYYGPAWYQKKVTIPQNWQGEPINLTLERPHWETTVWVDDQKTGMENRLGTPHYYDLTKYLTPGEHILTIRVDNRVKDIDPGLGAHSITDNTQTNWNGIVGDIKLTISPKISLGQVDIYPDVENDKVKVKVSSYSAKADSADKEVKAERNRTAKLSMQAVGLGNNEHVGEEITREITIDGNGSFELEYPMGNNYRLWDEFNPHLYKMNLRLESDSGVDEKEVDFGMRNFKAKGKQFEINGRRTFLRGTLECAIFPLTGYPPTDVESWKRIYNKIKDYGLNHMRFHSWCPPEAAFQAADEAGVYLQVEASAWATIGDGIQLGTISVDFSTAKGPQKLALTVNVDGHENSWDIWVYPAKREPLANVAEVRVVDHLNSNTLNYLINGGKVLLNINKGDIASGKGGDIGVGFSSIFWNTSWTNGQKPHILGILCNPDHPALSEFPTEYHSNWQWWDAMSHSNAIILDDFTTELKPIVRVIDDWFDNHRTALIFEAKVGKGKLVFSGVDLHTDLDNRLEAQQLLYSLKKYMASDDFDPKVDVGSDEILGLFRNK